MMVKCMPESLSVLKRYNRKKVIFKRIEWALTYVYNIHDTYKILIIYFIRQYYTDSMNKEHYQNVNIFPRIVDSASNRINLEPKLVFFPFF